MPNPPGQPHPRRFPKPQPPKPPKPPPLPKKPVEPDDFPDQDGNR